MLVLEREDSCNTTSQQGAQERSPQSAKAQKGHVFRSAWHQRGDAPDKDAHACDMNEPAESIGQGREGPCRERRRGGGLHRR